MVIRGFIFAEILIKMDVERALETIYLERQNLNQNKVLSGIKTLDKQLKGFIVTKNYLVIGQKGMAIETFVNTIKSNINILYQSQIDTDFLNFQYIDKQELKAINLNDLKQQTIENYDVIISLYRPSYYDTNLNDNHLKIQLLKNTGSFLSKEKLELDIQNKRVKSIKKNNDFLKKWSNQLKELLTEESLK